MVTRRPIFRRQVVCWVLYDWANSAFATTVMSGFFPVLYSALSGGISAERSQFWFNFALAASSILVAVSAPILGAIADRGGSRKKFLAGFASVGVLMTAGLAWVHAGMWQIGLLLYGLGSVGFAGANVFYDSMLVDVADEEEFDVVSAAGYGIGYVGGGLLFAVNTLMAARPELFGLESPSAAVAVSFITVAAWWTLFSLPLLFGVDERQTRDKVSARQAIREGIRQLVGTFREVRRLRVLALFLLAYWLYIDGVNTVMKTAVFFGDRILGLPAQELVTALLVTQFVAFPAAIGFGWLGKRIGPRPAILIALSVYLGATVYAWRWLDTGADFLKLAVAIGLVQGGVQSLSRSLYARLIPRSRAAEFFGFFNMVGKFSAILGPLLMGAVPMMIGGATVREGMLALSVLFVIGGALLWMVNVEKGVAAARAMDDGER